MIKQLPPKIKSERWNEAMALQAKLAPEINARWVGQKRRVLVESTGVARSEADAPDIDGRVIVSPKLKVGAFADVKITGVKDYDLVAV
jgi:ribosomal protein S12 methylthiotransferase